MRVRGLQADRNTNDNDNGNDNDDSNVDEAFELNEIQNDAAHAVEAVSGNQAVPSHGPDANGTAGPAATDDTRNEASRFAREQFNDPGWTGGHFIDVRSEASVDAGAGNTPPGKPADNGNMAEENEEDKEVYEDAIEYIAPDGPAEPRGFAPDQAPDFVPLEYNRELGEAGYASLRYRPTAIGDGFLISTIVFYSLCIAGLGTLIKLAPSHMAGFRISDPRLDVAIRYSPTTIGMVTKLVWDAIITALVFVIPYILMANPNPRQANRLRRTLANTYADRLVTSQIISVARNGHFLLFIGILAQRFVVPLLVPLKGELLQVVPVQGGWIVFVRPKVAYALISIYATLVLIAGCMFFTLRNRETGLRWDVDSPAEQLGLFQDSNILPLFQGLEWATPSECIQVLRQRISLLGTLRLGYWIRADGSIWHGAAIDQSTRVTVVAAEPDAAQDRISGIVHDDELGNPETPRDFLGRPVQAPEVQRYRKTGPFLSDASLLAFTLLLLLAMAFLIAKRVEIQKAAIEAPQLLTELSIKGLENFFKSLWYRFLPVSFMLTFSSIWNLADMYYRIMGPIAAMHIPTIVTRNAWRNSHYRVAFFSVLSLVSNLPPIFVTGIFASTPTATGYSISIRQLNFWASFATLIIYIICIIIARPPPEYRLPRSLQNICDLLSYCYASRALNETYEGQPIFSVQGPHARRADLEYRIRHSRSVYLFGLYMGSDNRRHLGFDIVDGRTDHVLTIEPGRAFYGGIFTWYWRAPHINYQ